MNMKLLILHHKNYITIFPGFRKAVLSLLFWLVSTYKSKNELGLNGLCTPPLTLLNCFRTLQRTVCFYLLIICMETDWKELKRIKNIPTQEGKRVEHYGLDWLLDPIHSSHSTNSVFTPCQIYMSNLN